MMTVPSGTALLRGAGLVLTAVLLGACQSSVGSLDRPAESVSHSKTAVVAGVKPAELYTLVARKVKACWLNPADPVLTKHIFHAVASPDGAVTNIVIHDRAPDGRRGLRAFSVNFTPRGRDTRIVTQNHRLPYALSQKLAADVGFWVQGSVTPSTCDAPAPASRGSGAPGPKS